MYSKRTQNWVRWVARGVVRASLLTALAWVLTAILLRWQLPSLEDLRARVLLTCIGLAICASVIEVINRTARIFPKSSMTGLIGTAFSLACYLLIIWTDLKSEAWLWRLWWLSAIASITASHVLLLRSASAGRRGIVEKTAITGAILLAILTAGLVLRTQFLAPPSTPYLLALAIVGPTVLTGSIIARIRVTRKQASPPPAPWVRLVWMGGATAGLFLAGFYLGRVTAPIPGVFEAHPGALAAMSGDEVAAMVNADLPRLRTLVAGVDALFAESAALADEVRGRQRAEDRTYYTPAEEERIRAMFMSYLAYRAALLRMVANYGSFQSVPDSLLRDRCFLVGYGAASTVMDASMALVATYRDDPSARRKLNEPDPQWGLPPEMFETIYATVLARRNVEAFEEMQVYFDRNRDRWRADGVLPAEDLQWLDARINRALNRVAQAGIDRDAAKFEQLLVRIRGDAYNPYYAAQSIISTWIGDTRLVGREPFISHEQIEQVRSQLQPGDIILERRNWFASNAFLPGFWPHAVLYVGSAEDLQRLGLIRRDEDGRWTSDHAAVRQRLDRYLAMSADGHAHAVIESVSDGVIFNTLEHSLHADYAAVVRPRLSDGQKAAAIAKAFAHEGKPYDFEFDFFTADKLVCTELVYRAYEGVLDFGLIRIMGRDTLPAIEIARKFGREAGREDRQLDFVCFLDTLPGARRATASTADAFVASADRPGAFNE